jgi:diadenosine tetraphosphatase ApaH/serine/threonine PP2A family protein phosphatase
MINLGSARQPRDGDPRVNCVVFDTECEKAEFLRLNYDIDAVCAKIEDRMPHADELIAILRREY